MIREFNGIKELSIFWSFVVDENLPKYKKDVKVETDRNGNTISFNNSDVPMMGGSWGSVDGDEVVTRKDLIKKPLLQRIITWFYDKFVTKESAKRKETEEQKLRSQQTILEFFTSLATNFKHLTPIGEVAEHYENALEQANETGQVSLQEKLKNIMDVARTETHLIQSDLKSYVTEGQIIDFYEATDRDKNLKLTWVKNFVKVIPSDIVDLKRDLDTKELFDNYVVLHYDPNNDATDITEAEKEIKKDPILFGVLENSRKLYYIGDWKDDYCDLTLEDMFVELEEEVLTINNRTVKTFINNGGSHTPKRKKAKK